MTVKDRFDEYHLDNPHVWVGFQQFTFQLLEAGCNVLSANRVYERMRWESDIRGNDMYKLNNDYRAYYARMFMEEYPEHNGKFRTREVQKDG